MRTKGNMAPNHSSGQSFVELAILLPILILILAGALDLARAYDSFVSITNASREGARYGAANPTNTAGIQNAVNRELTNTGIGGVTVSVGCFAYSDNSPISDCTLAEAGDRIKVTVEYNFNFAAFLIIGLNSVHMSNATTMAVAK
jgi:Flp pilus assembly protein TadG